jgi:isopropylmalate/homocitrate/citramalate synthase
MFKEIAEFISKACGAVVPPNKAMVGDYAFAHESGIHAHGVLSNPLTYEPYPPELIGNWRRMTIGKQSGKAAIKNKMEEILKQEIDTNEEKFQLVIDKVKQMYASGRRASLQDSEFKKVLSEAGY